MTEKIAVDESIVKDEVRTFDWEDKKVEVKRFLPTEDAMGYINDVVAGCLDENGNYFPEAIDFMRRREFIRRYTNIELPDDIMATYKILYGTELYDMVYEMVELDQLDVLWTAINDRVNMIKYDRRAAVEKQMTDMYAMMKNLFDALSETVGGVDSEQITELIKAIANNQVDEGKIVSALLDEKKKREIDVN